MTNKIARSSLQERLHQSAELDASLKNILRVTKQRGKPTTRMQVGGITRFGKSRMMWL